MKINTGIAEYAYKDYCNDRELKETIFKYHSNHTEGTVFTAHISTKNKIVKIKSSTFKCFESLFDSLSSMINYVAIKTLKPEFFLQVFFNEENLEEKHYNGFFYNKETGFLYIPTGVIKAKSRYVEKSALIMCMRVSRFTRNTSTVGECFEELSKYGSIDGSYFVKNKTIPVTRNPDTMTYGVFRSKEEIIMEKFEYNV